MCRIELNNGKGSVKRNDFTKMQLTSNINSYNHVLAYVQPGTYKFLTRVVQKKIAKKLLKIRL